MYKEKMYKEKMYKNKLNYYYKINNIYKINKYEYKNKDLSDCDKINVMENTMFDLLGFNDKNTISFDLSINKNNI